MTPSFVSRPSFAARHAGVLRRLPWLVLAVLALFPLLAPLFGVEYYVGFMRRVMIVAIAAASLNFILGYGGMAALGHAGFIGVGAYTVVALVEAGWILAGKPSIPSQARLPLFSMPSGVFSSRNMTMPKPSSHFQRLAASVRSIWDMRK